MKIELTEVFNILHDSFVDKIEIKDSILKLTLGAEFLASKLNKDYSYFYLEFDNAKDFEFEDWSKSKLKYHDVNTVLFYASELWFTIGECMEDGHIYINGCGGNSPDETSCGGTLSFKCDNYRIYKEDGNLLTLSKLTEAYRLYRKDMD